MKLTKEKKSNEEIVPAVDVELNEEQLETLAGGIVDRGDGTGCTGGTIFYEPTYTKPKTSDAY